MLPTFSMSLPDVESWLIYVSSEILGYRSACLSLTTLGRIVAGLVRLVAVTGATCSP